MTTVPKPYPSVEMDYDDWNIVADILNTKGSATLTTGDTFKQITHGYGATPDHVFVQPTSNLGGRNMWVPRAYITATTFRVYISSSDTIDHTFDWAVK